MPIFDDILVWNDETPRTGAENMATDQLLLESVADTPILRFYGWSEPSISFGYFESLAEAQRSFPDDAKQPLKYIRRWTGGGIVDHRIDLTYTLAVPKHVPLAQLRGAESYRIIHQAVADALNAQGIDCTLTSENANSESAACFQKPVTYDIVTPNGTKLAGAGQKRTRYGLLHQGSVLNISDKEHWQVTLTSYLAKHTTAWNPESHWLEQIQQLSTERYATEDWLRKR